MWRALYRHCYHLHHQAVCTASVIWIMGFSLCVGPTHIFFPLLPRGAGAARVHHFPLPADGGSCWPELRAERGAPGCHPRAHPQDCRAQVQGAGSPRRRQEVRGLAAWTATKFYTAKDWNYFLFIYLSAWKMNTIFVTHKQCGIWLLEWTLLWQERLHADIVLIPIITQIHRLQRFQNLSGLLLFLRVCSDYVLILFQLLT